jgi:hypothetical protein
VAGGAPDTELRARPGKDLAATSTSSISSASTSAASGITSSGGGVPVLPGSRMDGAGATTSAPTWRAGARDGRLSQDSSASTSQVGAAVPVTKGASSRSHLCTRLVHTRSSEPSHRRGFTHASLASWNGVEAFPRPEGQDVRTARVRASAVAPAAAAVAARPASPPTPLCRHPTRCRARAR